jgi:hypothetical protein
LLGNPLCTLRRYGCGSRSTDRGQSPKTASSEQSRHDEHRRKIPEIVYLALALILVGILGEWWKIEGGILKLGEFLKNRFARNESGKDYSYGFFNASVLFCVGAMTLVGAFMQR